MARLGFEISFWLLVALHAGIIIGLLQFHEFDLFLLDNIPGTGKPGIERLTPRFLAISYFSAMVGLLFGRLGNDGGTRQKLLVASGMLNAYHIASLMSYVAHKDFKALNPAKIESSLAPVTHLGALVLLWICLGTAPSQSVRSVTATPPYSWRFWLCFAAISYFHVGLTIGGIYQVGPFAFQVDAFLIDGVATSGKLGLELLVPILFAMNYCVTWVGFAMGVLLKRPLLGAIPFIVSHLTVLIGLCSFLKSTEGLNDDVFPIWKNALMRSVLVVLGVVALRSK